MTAPVKISSFQFYNILFLSRFFAVVTYIANLRIDLSPSDKAASSVFTALYLFVTCIPTYLLLRKDSQSSIITRASCLSPVFAKILCIVYIADFLYYGTVTAARFELLISSVMFPETNMAFFMLVPLAVAGYGAYKGIEAQGRAAAFFLVLVLLSFAFVFLTILKDFDPLNFPPLFYEGAGGSAAIGAFTCARTGEVFSVALLLPFVKNHKNHHIFLWSAAVGVTVIAADTVISGVLGTFGNTQLFSMYSVSVLAEFGFVERMDAVITCIWMLCAVVKLSFTVFACSYLLSCLFGKKLRLLYISLTAAALFAGMLAVSSSVLNFASVVTSAFTIYGYVFTACVVPLAVLLGEKIKQNKNNKNIENKTLISDSAGDPQ